MSEQIYVTVNSDYGFEEYWINNDQFEELSNQLLRISLED